MEEGEKVSRSVLFWPPSFPPLLLCPQQELVAIDSALSGSFLLVLSALPRNHCLGTEGFCLRSVVATWKKFTIHGMIVFISSPHVDTSIQIVRFKDHLHKCHFNPYQGLPHVVHLI